MRRAGIRHIQPLILVLALVLAAPVALAQQCLASAKARVSVNIVEAAGGGFSQDDLLGEVVLDGSAGQPPTAVIGRLAGVRGDGAQHLTLRPATLHLAGGSHTTFALILPEDGACSAAGPGSPIPAREFQVSPGGAAEAGGRNPDAGGATTFQVGASLDIPPGEPAAAYAGRYLLTMACD